jgi:hypothetical protein
MSLIDGFAIDCGYGLKIITLKNGIYKIGLFEGTKEQAIKMIKNKYDGKEQQDYLQKLNDCENMEWFTDDVHSLLKDNEYWKIRKTVAEYSNKFHYQLKDDEDKDVRLAVAKFSNKYHSQLKNDIHRSVRFAVANFKKEEK